MLGNSPLVRGVLYVAMILFQLGTFIAARWDVGFAGSLQDAANWLAALAGMTALGNLPPRAASPPPSAAAEAAGRELGASETQ